MGNNLIDLESMVNKTIESGSELLLVNGIAVDSNKFLEYVLHREDAIQYSDEEDGILYMVIDDKEFEIEIA